MPSCVIFDKRPLEYGFLDNAASNTGGNATSYTFSAFNFGTADPERYIVVGVGTSVAGGGLPTGVTIGGVTATRIRSSSLGTNPTADLWQAIVPTGTSGSVVVSYSGNTTRIVSIVGWYILPALSESYSIDKGSSGAAPIAASDSINVPATGIAFGIAVGNAGTASWSGLTEDANFPTGTQRFTAASYQSSSGDTNKNISVTFATATAVSAVFAVFQP